jgi:predicted O-linked N-acetylglucosamine transferase (SPINDLY family)
MTQRKTQLNVEKLSRFEILDHIGNAIKGENFDAAINLAAQGIKRFPNDILIYASFGRALRLSGREEEALRFLKAASKKYPKSIDVGIELMEVLHDIRDYDSYRTYLMRFHRLVADILHDKGATKLVHQAHNNLTAKALTVPGFSRYEIDQLHRERRAKTNKKTYTKPEGRARIGIFSWQIMHHSVGFFCRPFLRACKDRPWDVTVYYDNKGDSETKRLTKEFLKDHGIRMVEIDLKKSPSHARTTILQDKMDVIIEMAGRLEGHYLPIIRSRLAPIQVSWIGYPHHPGFANIDYFLSDTYCEPIEQHDDSRLPIYRFNRLFSAYEPPAEIPIRHRPIPSNKVTFGSFNHIRKISSSNLGVWAQILKRKPDSSILFKSRSISTHQRKWILTEMQRLGVELDRIEIISETDIGGNHLDHYNNVDICLDSFPYNGTTTTCESLHMGVPVIALLGDMHVSRVSAAILNSIGSPELVATSEGDYIEKAVALSNNLASLREYKTSLRTRMLCSQLCDAEDMADAFQELLDNVLYVK